MEGLAADSEGRLQAGHLNAHRSIRWKPVVKDNLYKVSWKREKKRVKIRCHLRGTGLLEKNHYKLVDNQRFQAVGKSGQSCRLHLVLCAKETSLFWRAYF